MIKSSSKKDSLSFDYETDRRWRGPGGDIFVQVKRTSSVRDIRDTLLALAYDLKDSAASARACCVVTDTRLTLHRLADELEQFRSIMRPALAARTHLLHASVEGVFHGSMASEPSEFYTWLRAFIRHEASDARPGLAHRQIVIAALAQLLLQNAKPVTMKRLQEICNVSYPTVVAALKQLHAKDMLEEATDGVRLKTLLADQWLQLARQHADKRTVVLFTDPTGLASPDALVKRLWKLQQQDKAPDTIRVGGVLGASHYFPALDVTAAQRLDLSMEGTSLDIVHKLDAALVEQKNSRQKPVLAAHLTRDPQLLAGDTDPSRKRWASELECLADLVETGLLPQAAEWADHLAHSTSMQSKATP